MYSDLPNLQATWETDPGHAGPGGILTDYISGDRATLLQANPTNPAGTGCGGCHATTNPPVLSADGEALLQSQVDSFVRDLDQVVPGALAAARRRPDGSYVVARGHWLRQGTSRGSYTCYLPGQFTGLAGLEAEPVDALKFAGEHTDSFYEWQGFMEGAANSGLRAAAEILNDIKRGRL